MKLEEEARYRRSLRGSTNPHVQAESKMLDTQYEAEQKVLASRRNRIAPASWRVASKKTRKDQLAGIGTE